MATVKMIRGSRIADIFDSPETIAQAKKDGFEMYEELKSEPVKEVKEGNSDTSTPKTNRTKRQ